MIKQIACATPGIKNSKQSAMLIIKSLLAPFFINTAIGSSSIAKIIITILLSFV
jgi:hypothetical protein